MCSALASGLHDMATAPGLSVVGSTAIHLRFAPKRRLPFSCRRTRPATLCRFPIRSYAQMQINMAGTLTIDWMLDLARDVLASEGARPRKVRFDQHNRRPGHGLRSMGAALFHP